MEKLHIMLKLTPIEMTCRKLSGFTFFRQALYLFSEEKSNLVF